MELGSYLVFNLKLSLDYLHFKNAVASELARFAKLLVPQIKMSYFCLRVIKYKD